MLEDMDWDKLKKLAFTGYQSRGGRYPGLHRSNMRGSGIEFHEYRPYCPGDDAGQVDWKLFGRTDRCFIRQSRSPIDLSAYVLLDRTASMDFPTSKGKRSKSSREQTNKFRYASGLAAAIAYVISKQSDSVGLGLYSDALTTHVPPSRDRAQFQRILGHLKTVTASQGIGNTGKAVRETQRLLSHRGVIILISDMLDPIDQTFEAIGQAKHAGFELVVFQVMSTVELTLEGVHPGALRIVDSETQDTKRVHLSRVKSDYIKRIRNHNEAVQKGCARLGVGYFLYTTSRPVIDSLGSFMQLNRQRSQAIFARK